MDLLSCTLDRLSQQVLPLTEKDSSSSNAPLANTYQPFQTRNMKLNFPRFDGSDPLQWLFRAEQFFTYYDTPDAQRLTIAAVQICNSLVPDDA